MYRIIQRGVNRTRVAVAHNEQSGRGVEVDGYVRHEVKRLATALPERVAVVIRGHVSSFHSIRRHRW